MSPPLVQRRFATADPGLFMTESTAIAVALLAPAATADRWQSLDGDAHDLRIVHAGEDLTGAPPHDASVLVLDAIPSRPDTGALVAEHRRARPWLPIVVRAAVPDAAGALGLLRAGASGLVDPLAADVEVAAVLQRAAGGQPAISSALLDLLRPATGDAAGAQGVAAALHDGPVQALTFARVRLELARLRADDPSDQRKALADVEEALADASTSLAGLVDKLRSAGQKRGDA